MCLAVPGKVIRIINDNQAEVLLGDIKKRVHIDLLPETRKDDYVLIHAGYAITRIKPEEADEVRKAWEEIES